MKSINRFERYGVYWKADTSPLLVEMDCIRMGGRWKKKSGGWAGLGLFEHFKRAQQLIWPDKVWHRWNELELKCYLEYRYIGEMGCAAAGKTDSAASNVLMDWLCFPDSTTVLVSSTTLPALELRVWGSIKKYFRKAKTMAPWLPGHLIEGKRVIILDPKTEAAEGRDFKNGLIAIACKRGQTFLGLGEYVGIHNKRVRLLGDELSLMPRAFIDSASNLAKCPDFKLLGLGNPNETTNAHGMLCEPSADLGGWEGGIDQGIGTKTWRTRFPDGICIQLPGSDSPNMDAPEGVPPPYPFLITRKQMADDAKIWGINDWHYTMMNDGKMPRGQGTRRVITRQMCEKFGAMDVANWSGKPRTKIAFLDAAYRAVGGDRCVFGVLEFGEEAAEDIAAAMVTNLISQNSEKNNRSHILSLISTTVIPISAEKDADLPEDQIVKFVQQQCLDHNIPPKNFFFDSGMRTSLVTAFARLWSPLVESIDCGGSPSDRRVSSEIDMPCKDYYSKKITEFWYSVRLIIEAGQFRGMTEDVMVEGCAREFKRVAGNRIEIESKEEMKLKFGRSPDLFDALAIGVEGARQRGFTIKRLSNPRAVEKDDSWKEELRIRQLLLKRAHQLDFKA
jgi:hypothetical protein